MPSKVDYIGQNLIDQNINGVKDLSITFSRNISKGNNGNDDENGILYLQAIISKPNYNSKIFRSFSQIGGKYLII